MAKTETNMLAILEDDGDDYKTSFVTNSDSHVESTTEDVTEEEILEPDDSEGNFSLNIMACSAI